MKHYSQCVSFIITMLMFYALSSESEDDACALGLGPGSLWPFRCLVPLAELNHLTIAGVGLTSCSVGPSHLICTTLDGDSLLRHVLLSVLMRFIWLKPLSHSAEMIGINLTIIAMFLRWSMSCSWASFQTHLILTCAFASSSTALKPTIAQQPFPSHQQIWVCMESQ